MKKHIEYQTRGTCSRGIIVDIEDDVIVSCRFIGGCSGNTQGISALVVGMRIDDVISRLAGIECGSKMTSCPDQLARALRSARSAN